MMNDRIIDDYKNTIARLQQECTEKTDNIIALGEQLKRKEKECEKTKESLDEFQKAYSKLSQRYENKGWSKEYDELKQQLQAEKEKVKELEKRFKSSESWRIRAEDMNEKFSLKVGIYKQALEEIRQIVIFSMEEVLTLGQKNATDEILQKCEVLNE